MYCKTCGKELDESFAFCDNCGAPAVKESPKESDVRTENKTEPKAAPTAQPAVQQTYYRNEPVYNQPQPVYSAYQYQAPVQNNVQPVATLGQYIAWMLIGLIPVIGTIIAIVLAIDNSNKNRSNFFRAQIVIVLAAAALVLIFWSAIVSLLYDLLWSL